MKKFLSATFGLSLVMGSATCLLMANEPEKPAKHEKQDSHQSKDEHKDAKPADHKPEHPPEHAPEHK